MPTITRYHVVEVYKHREARVLRDGEGPYYDGATEADAVLHALRSECQLAHRICGVGARRGPWVYWVAECIEYVE